MRIVIDTNIFCEDYYLRGSNFRVLFDGLHSLPGTLLIPEVVVDEVVNRYREDLQEITSKERETRNSLSRMLSDPSSVPPLNVDVVAQANAYRAYLEAVIAQHGKVLPYPQTSHKIIVERDLARRKPFKRDGSGYRDLLIWETIKSQMIWGTERVILLTNNPKDFGEGPLVDPELQPEILNPAHLQLIRSLREFNEAFVTPRLRMIEGAKAEAFSGASANVDLAAWLRSNLIDILYFEESLGPLVAGFPDGAGCIRPSELVAFHDLKIISARQLESKETLVRISVDAELEFLIDIDWDDFVNHPEVRDWAGEDHEPFSSSSSHHVARLRVVLDLVISSSAHSVDSHELVSLESDYGDVEFK